MRRAFRQVGMSRSRRWRAGTRRNKKHRYVGGFKSDRKSK